MRELTRARSICGIGQRLVFSGPVLCWLITFSTTNRNILGSWFWSRWRLDFRYRWTESALNGVDQVSSVWSKNYTILKMFYKKNPPQNGQLQKDSTTKRKSKAELRWISIIKRKTQSSFQFASWMAFQDVQLPLLISIAWNQRSSSLEKKFHFSNITYMQRRVLLSRTFQSPLDGWLARIKEASPVHH